MKEKIPEEYPSTPLIQEIGRDEWPSRSFDPENEERPPVTPETKEKMDRELVALGNLMENSGVWWQLDGALNISIRKGEYIGTHVDVDISLLQDEVPALERYLAARGYGLFLRKVDPASKDRIFRRVGADAFKVSEPKGWHRRIGALDEAGNINLNADLVSADISLIGKDTDGRPLGWRDVAIPEKWLTGEIVDFHGVPIHLSHPGRFLFNKVWFARGYDRGDLEEFAKTGTLSLEDIEDVEQLVTPMLEMLESEKKITRSHADLVRSRFPWIRELIKVSRKT